MTAKPQKRVVLVEAEAPLAQALSVALASGGYFCDTVVDADELQQSLRAKRPDLILIDGIPEGPDPRALCQLLRDDPANGDVKIVIINGSGRSIERRRCRALGADGILAKPFGLDDLRREMHRLLSDAPLEAV